MELEDKVKKEMGKHTLKHIIDGTGISNGSLYAFKLGGELGHRKFINLCKFFKLWDKDESDELLQRNTQVGK